MQWTRVKRLTQAVSPVITLDEARDHLRVLHSLDDAYIERLVQVSTDAIEGPTGAGIPLWPCRWALTLDHLPRHFDIDLCPVRSIDRITVNGQEIDPSRYTVDLDSIPARVCVDHVTPHKLGSVKVEFTAGYDVLPEDLRHAILMLVSHYYENREAVSATDFKEVPFAVSAILNRYRAY